MTTTAPAPARSQAGRARRRTAGRRARARQPLDPGGRGGRGVDRDLVLHRGHRHPGPARHLAHRPARPAHRVPERPPRRARHQPPHAVHQRDRRRAAQRRRVVAADDRAAQLPAPGAGDRLAGGHGPGDVRRPGGGQLADRPAGAGLVPLLRRLRLLAGLARPAHHHRHLGGRWRCSSGCRWRCSSAPARAPTRSSPCSSTSCRRCRRSSTCCRSCCSSASAPAPRSSRPSSTRSRRSSGSPASGSARSRRRPSRPPTRPARRTGSGCCKVQLPMARKTIIVGLNQTTLAALSMATLAAFVNGPGLGKPVLAGLRINDVGTAFVPGALIVVMAVMLDRTTTAASERAEKAARGRGGDPRLRRILLIGGGRRDPRRDLPLAHLQGPGGVPDVRHRRQGRDGGQRRRRLVHRHLRRRDRRHQGRDHQRLPQPDAVAARRLAVVARLPGDLRAGLRLRWPPRPGEHRHLPGRHLVLRPVARRDDHAEHDPGRHGARDDPGAGLRRLDGPRPPGRPRHPAACWTPARRSRRSST